LDTGQNSLLSPHSLTFILRHAAAAAGGNGQDQLSHAPPVGSYPCLVAT